MRAAVLASVLCLLVVPGSSLGGGGTGAKPSAVESVAFPDSGALLRTLPNASSSSYWIAEFRRRWHAERRTVRVQAATIRRLRRELRVRLTPSEAVCAVFGGYCSQALTVALCESHLWTGARNGQHLGIFQMGESERATYGHGPTAIEQARAAYRYFVASGRDWSPWECRP